MIFHMNKPPRGWSNECPKCGNRLKWRMTNSKAGSKTLAECSKSIGSSRVVRVIRDIDVCSWQGQAIRQADGGVRFKDLSGGWLPEV